MMADKGNARLVLTRPVTRAECPWLDFDYPAGAIVYAYSGATYGCVSPSGRAVTEKDGETPFVELPRDALDDCPLAAAPATCLGEGAGGGCQQAMDVGMPEYSCVGRCLYGEAPQGD